MILKGNQRGGSKQLAVHLLKTEDNEHVEIHEVRGFVAESLQGAMQEAYAISRATKCQKYLFSLSLSPPEKEAVSVESFEAAISDIEEQLGLVNQPRLIVFHEKEGRRHGHCVWSRIDYAEMKAIKLPYYKVRLRGLSRLLFIQHGWKMPKGLVNSKERDPTAFTQAEYEQAKRAGRDPKAIKEIFQDCWAISDSSAAFANAMEERGYYLAKGDRRGFVALDFQGEVFSVAKWTGKRTKEVKERLGPLKKLPSVQATREKIAKKMTKNLKGHIAHTHGKYRTAARLLEGKRQDLVSRHRTERQNLKEAQEARWIDETKKRFDRLPTGLKGIWSRLTGRYAKIRARNEQELSRSRARDRGEKQGLVVGHLRQRQALQRDIKQLRQRHTREITRLYRDVATYMRLGEMVQQQRPGKQRRRANPERNSPRR